MLKEYIENGFGIKEDLNCAEKIVYGANDVYKLGLSKDCLRLAGGFGGGLGVEDTCRVVTGASMVFSHIFIKERAHESTKIKEINKEFIRRFRERLGTINCRELKEMYCKGPQKCSPIIIAGAAILDEILSENSQEQR